MTTGDRIAAAALALRGVPFRAQGRDPVHGVDCVGVVAIALARAGVSADLPRRYALRSGEVPPASVPLCLASCDGGQAGDVLLLRVSAAQLHLAIRTEQGFVHADVQARRVVERRGVPPWPVAAAWRSNPRKE